MYGVFMVILVLMTIGTGCVYGGTLLADPDFREQVEAHNRDKKMSLLFFSISLISTIIFGFFVYG